MKIRIAQMLVLKDIEANQAKILKVLEESEAGEWVVFPEAVLSGYYPHEAVYTEGLDWERLQEGLDEIQKKVVEKECQCLVGSAVLEGGAWRNSVQLFGAGGECGYHYKQELSTLDRNHFSPGSELKVHRVGGVTVGALACRELLFPAHWLSLREDGAKVIFHLNNAIHPKDGMWESLLIARAIENAAFVVSVNNADAPQALASYVIGPDGTILQKTRLQVEEVLAQVIDLGEAPDDLALRQDF